jgi:hypothetical protein
MTPPDGSYQACIDAVKQTLGKEATDDQVEQIAEDVQKRAKKLKGRDPLLSDADAALQAARELGDQAKLAALIEKRSRVGNIIKKQSRMSRVNQRTGREARAYQEMMAGSQDGFYGSADSVDATAHTLTAELVSPMQAELRAAGLDRLIQKGGKPFERDVARELFRLTNKEGVESGNKSAAEAAQIIAKYQEAARKLQNDAGAWIGKVDGYITRQSHDPYKIRRAGYERWRNATIEQLDPLKTFTDAADVDKFMKHVYDGLASGVHMATKSEWLGGFKGPGNLAKRASQERVLHFKSADHWFDYNEEFGTSGLFEGVLGGLQHAAKNAAIMQRFGTNPEAAFLADVAQLAEAARDRGDFKTSDKFKAAGQKSGELGRLFSVISGEVDIAENVTGAAIAATARSTITMSKLGGVFLSAFPDIPVKAASLRHHGINFLEGVHNGLESVLAPWSGAHRREIGDLIGVGIDGTLGSVFHKFGSHDNVPGRMSKMVNTFMKWNLLNWWTDNQARGVAFILSRNLANQVKKPFAQLDPDLQRSIGRYGITPEDWDVIRQADTKHDGGKHLTPERVSDKDIGRKLRMYYVDSTREAMTMAGAYERSITTMGYKRGTVVGEAIRFIMQFKSYGITFMSRHIGRELKRKGHVDFVGLAALIGTTTAMGYVSMQAKEIAKGRTPRTADDAGGWAKIFTASMVQGGGLGIYGDFLFGQYNRTLGGGLETLLGPAAGESSDILKMLGKVTTGDWEDLPADAIKFTKDNTPFVNLFYTRMALDMLVLYDLQERMSPGYLRRMERRIKKDNGQRFILPPSSKRATPFT